MNANTSRANPVPKKLEKGMAVVVYIKPEYTLIGKEERTKLKKEVWLKGKILSQIVGGLVFVTVNGCTFSNIVSGLIIIRSTAYADTMKPVRDAHNKRANAARNQRRAAAKVKHL